MTHTELCAWKRNKVRGYTLAQCQYALVDCHATLALWKDAPQGDRYVGELWAEVDALRDRAASLQRTASLVG